MESNALQKDAALQRRLQAFGAAAAEHGVKTTVHERISSREKGTHGQFGQKAIIAISMVAGIWATAAMVNKTGDQPAGVREQVAQVNTKNIRSPQEAEFEKMAEEGRKAQAEAMRAIDEAMGIKHSTPNKTAPSSPPPASKEVGGKSASTSWEAPGLDGVRERLHYMEVQDKKNPKVVHQVLTPDSQLALVKAVHKSLDLGSDGVDEKDLYAVISAETAWIPKNGVGANKVISTGLAQLEPATAKAIGVKDPTDPVQAVWGAGYLLKEAAQWSRARVQATVKHDHLRLTSAQMHSAIKDGYSIYYNTSGALRDTWKVTNTNDFPDATRQHIANSRYGRSLHDSLKTQIPAQINYLTAKAFPEKADASTPGINKLADGLVEIERIKRAETLTKAIDSPCEIKLQKKDVSGVEMHSICRRPNGQLIDSAGVVDERVGSVIEIGQSNGIPVYMTSKSQQTYGAMLMKTPNAPSPYAILVQDSLIKQFEKDVKNPSKRSEMLAFIIGHELGHIPVNERMSSDRFERLISGTSAEADVIANEIDADSESLEYLKHKGMHHDDAKETATQSLEVVHNFFKSESQSPFVNEYVGRMMTERASSILHAHDHRDVVRPYVN